MVLILAGTNMFTFATSRYWTTKDVLTRAQERVQTAARKDGVQLSRSMQFAISFAGGLYYWWNDGLIYWTSGATMTVIGFLVPFVESRKPANKVPEDTIAEARR